MAKTSVGVQIDRSALEKISREASNEIARTLGFELLRRSTQNVTSMKAVDTGNLRASGHVLVDGDPPTSDEIPAAGEGEAIVAYGADYARVVHEGLGSNSSIGPRPFLYQAGEELQIDAQSIADDIIRRKYGG